MLISFGMLFTELGPKTQFAFSELTTTRYVMTGTLDDGPDALPPKGEFFTSQRNKFMPQIPGWCTVT